MIDSTWSESLPPAVLVSCAEGLVGLGTVTRSGVGMEYRLLGPLEVRAGDHVVDVGSRRQRALLCVLLLHPNRVVSTDDILDALWGADGANKENAMWVAVSRLRTALDAVDGSISGRSVLATRDHGYVLSVDVDALDVDRFEAAIRDARNLLAHDPGAASAQAEHTLVLWRGTPLEEFRYEQFAQFEVARLEELHLEALEIRADAELALGRAQAQVSLLEQLHQQYPLRERLVDLLMRTLYQTGRQADALRLYERHRHTIGEELGVEPSPELRRLEEHILLHDLALQRVAPDTSIDVVNPFKGLRSFEEADVADFFGRDRLVADVISKLGEGRRLVALVGASGSGKSSAVRAGVIPAVRKGALDRSERWLIAEMVPGAHPIVELEAAMLRSTLDAPDTLSEQLQDATSGLLRAALRILPPGACLLVVVDQFEELFTLVADESERRQFLDLIESGLDDPHGRVLVLLTLRADFYDRPLQYPALSRRLGDGVVNVASLNADELEAAAEEPMRRAGVRVEPALLATLLSEVVGQPGALPLFQYTLTVLFDRRVGGVVSLAQYHTMGGLRGALAQRAEDLYADLGSDEKDATCQLFLRLVSITQAHDWSRRRVPASELVSLGGDLVPMQTAIGVFGAQRLLTFDRDQVSGSPTVEVAHEALLTEWPRLRGWIDEAREDVIRHASLIAAIHEWRVAEQSPGYLLVGQRLLDFEFWSRHTMLELTHPEREFLEASIAARDDVERGESDRRARDAAHHRRWARLTSVIAFVVLGAVVATAAWAFTRSSPPRIVWMRANGDPGDISAQVRNGWEQAQRDLDFEAIDLQVVSDPTDELRALLRTGIDMVFIDLSIGGRDAVDLVAMSAEYPDVRFVVPVNNGEPPIDLPNVTTVAIDAADGSFLAGAAAALTSSTGTIGFVGATPAGVDDFRVGYEAGARWAVPDVEVLSTYLDSDAYGGQIYLRPDLGRAAAERLYRAGADVVFHAAGESGDWIPALAADLSDSLGRQLWVIGVDVDQALAVTGAERDHVLTSMLKRHDKAIEIAIELFLQGTLPSHLELGLADGAVGWSEVGGHMAPATTDRLESAAAQIRDGSLAVPDVSARPPSSLPQSDAVVAVKWTDAGCEIAAPPHVWDGDRLRVELANAATGPREVWLSRGTPPDSGPALGLAAVAGGSNAGVAQVSADLHWDVACRNPQTGQLSAIDAARRRPGPALRRRRPHRVHRVEL